MQGTPLGPEFFDRDPQAVACDLIGKALCHRVQGRWLGAVIVETEAYYLWDRASHASLGYTDKRRALFMPPGTLYLYYARGGDSFNVSCAGEGNAVLVKAGRVAPAAGARAPPAAALCDTHHQPPPMVAVAQQPDELLRGQP